MKLRTALKNKVNNILSAGGINLAKEALSSEKKLNEVLALPLDPLVQIELRILVEPIRSLNHSIGQLEKTIAERAFARRGAGKAIIALARKFLGIVYRTLKNNWVFEDLPNFALEEGAKP